MPKYERIGNDLPDSLQPLGRSSLVVRTGSLVASILVLAAEGYATLHHVFRHLVGAPA